jgi:hypothetical protein
MTRLAISWLILIIGGILTVLLTLVFISKVAAVVGGGLTLVSWICWGVVTSYYLGIRRHVFKHLGGDPVRWQVVTDVIPTSERVNVQLALDHLRGVGPAALPLFGVDTSPHASGWIDVIHLVRANPFPQPLNILQRWS